MRCRRCALPTAQNDCAFDSCSIIMMSYLIRMGSRLLMSSATRHLRPKDPKKRSMLPHSKCTESSSAPSWPSKESTWATSYLRLSAPSLSSSSPKERRSASKTASLTTSLRTRSRYSAEIESWLIQNIIFGVDVFKVFFI